MPRSTAAEVARRVDALYDLLLQGVGRHGIQAYAAGHGWDVSSRQLDTYSARAKVQLAKAAERDRAVELGRALERLDLLFMKALAENDRAEARAVLKDTTELLGLAAAQRHELSRPRRPAAWGKHGRTRRAVPGRPGKPGHIPRHPSQGGRP